MPQEQLTYSPQNKTASQQEPEMRLGSVCSCCCNAVALLDKSPAFIASLLSMPAYTPIDLQAAHTHSRTCSKKRSHPSRPQLFSASLLSLRLPRLAYLLCDTAMGVLPGTSAERFSPKMWIPAAVTLYKSKLAAKHAAMFPTKPLLHLFHCAPGWLLCALLAIINFGHMCVTKSICDK